MEKYKNVDEQTNVRLAHQIPLAWVYEWLAGEPGTDEREGSGMSGTPGVTISER